MESQKAELRLRLKKYMENSNGEGCWDLYIGSEMEADIIAFVLQELEPPSTEEITDAVDNISLLSTAPDAETPEWMKTDIKGGIDWALNFYRQKSRSVNPTDTLKELFKRNDQI